jgi:hypothetical protein
MSRRNFVECIEKGSVSPARIVTSSIDSLLSIQRAGGLERARSAESYSAASRIDPRQRYQRLG